MCEEILDIPVTGHRVGKENKGIQGGLSPTSETLVCTPAQKSLSKQQHLSEAAGEGIWG